MYFTALYEKCDIAGHMKDIRLPIVNVLLMLRKWWKVVRENYCSLMMRVSGKFSNQIFLEVLMNCTKHFDLSSSLTASCVARFMIC